jgi:hypothetical protein
MRTLRAILLTAAAASAAPPFACPSGTGEIPAAFLGSARAAAGGAALLATPTALYLTPPGAAIGAQFCVLDAFPNPNSPRQLFVTIGSARNAPADQDVTCAFLDLTHAPQASFNVSDPTGQACPINTGLPFAAWRAGAPPPALPACPASAVALPPALQGEGRLADAEASGNSRLLLAGSAWVSVLQGALVETLCVAAVAPAAGAAGATELRFSNAAAGGGAAKEACAWVAPAPPARLRYKFGAGSACPGDFSHPSTIAFNFTGGHQSGA